MKIGTFNLFNLQKANVPYYDRTDSEEVVNKKVDWIKSQMDKMKVDICGFQEAWDEETLKRALPDGQNLIMAKNDSGPSVALASSFPILNTEIISDYPSALLYENVEIPFYRFNRPVLRAQLQINENLNIHVYVAHLKSKRPIFLEGEDKNDPIVKSKGSARSLITRMSESIALREILLNKLKDKECPVFALGDVNDSGRAVTTQIVSGEPPFHRLPYEQKLKVWDTLLYHVKDVQARQSTRDIYYTHIYNGHFESIDHILVSQEFHRGNPNRLGYIQDVKLFNDHLVDSSLTNDQIPRWQSDHGQVQAQFRIE